MTLATSPLFPIGAGQAITRAIFQVLPPHHGLRPTRLAATLGGLGSGCAQEPTPETGPRRPPAHPTTAETTTAGSWVSGIQEAPPADGRPRWARWALGGPGLGRVWSESGIQSLMHFRRGQFHFLVRPGPISPSSRERCASYPFGSLFSFFLFRTGITFLVPPSLHLSATAHPGAISIHSLLAFRLQRFRSPGTELLHTQPLPISSSTPSEKDRVLPVLFIRRSLQVLLYVTKPTVHLPALETNLSDQEPEPFTEQPVSFSTTHPPRTSQISPYHRFLPPRPTLPAKASRRKRPATPSARTDNSPCSSVACCPVSIVTSHPRQYDSVRSTLSRPGIGVSQRGTQRLSQHLIFAVGQAA